MYQNYLYYSIIHSLLHKIYTLTVLGLLLWSSSVSHFFQDAYPGVFATVVEAKDQLMSFDMKEVLESEKGQNETKKNSSNFVDDEGHNKLTNCEMPPCPPGQACIQSCP
jgi:hypothetical protein